MLLAEWNHNYVLTSLAVRNGILVAGDILYSVAALRIVDSKLQTVAKHFTPLMPVCLGVSEDESIVGANVNTFKLSFICLLQKFLQNDGNLFSFKMPPAGSLQKLDQDGCYRVDDNVNRILLGGRAGLCALSLKLTFSLESQPEEVENQTQNRS